MKKIKQPKTTGGTLIPAPQMPVGNKFNFNHPVFCLKYLHKDYGVEKCEKEDRAALLKKMAALSKMTWDDIKQAPRHGLGTEKINRGAIIPSIPKEITKDVDTFLAMRYSGMKAIIGYRTDFIFHIVYIDRDFTVYNH